MWDRQQHQPGPFAAWARDRPERAEASAQLLPHARWGAMSGALDLHTPMPAPLLLWGATAQAREGSFCDRSCALGRGDPVGSGGASHLPIASVPLWPR